MGVFQQIMRFGSDFLEAGSKTGLGKIVAPLDAHNMEQYRKLGQLIGSKESNVAFSDIAYNYFQGRNIKNVGQAIEYTDPNRALSRNRKMLYGTAFGLAAANALDINPGGVTDKATSLGMLGGHYYAGKTLMAMGGKAKIAGLGYLGAAAINTFREGDNLGPM